LGRLNNFTTTGKRNPYRSWAPYRKHRISAKDHPQDLQNIEAKSTL